MVDMTGFEEILDGKLQEGKAATGDLVRMRSPVQIWVAAPLKPVVLQGIAGFYYFFQQSEN